MTEPQVAEQYPNTISQVKAWPAQGMLAGTPASVRGRVKHAFPPGENDHPQWGLSTYQSFFLEQDGEADDIKVFWSSSKEDLTQQVGAIVLLGQNNGKDQKGHCELQMFNGEAQLKVGGHCLRFEERMNPPPPAPPPQQTSTPLPAPPASFQPGVSPPHRVAATLASKPTVNDIWNLQNTLYERWRQAHTVLDDVACAALINTVVIGVTQNRIKDRDDPEAHPGDGGIPF